MTMLPPMLRSLLLWLALLAFPGLAAAAAQPCALHAHGAGPMPMQMLQMQTGSADAGPPMAQRQHRVEHDAEHHTGHQATLAAACHDDGDHDHPHGDHEHGRCSACAACCAGVAPAPAIALAPGAGGPAYVAVPFRPGHLPSVDPVLPERPPRPALA